MNDLRKLMNLFESSDEVAFENELVEGEMEDCDDCEEIVDEAIDPALDAETGLEGTLDPRALAKLLPEIDDIARFTNAVRKVQKGDNASLSMQEVRQLAKAFISLLKDDSQTTMKALQKLKMVHSTDGTEI